MPNLGDNKLENLLHSTSVHFLFIFHTMFPLWKNEGTIFYVHVLNITPRSELLFFFQKIFCWKLLPQTNILKQIDQISYTFNCISEIYGPLQAFNGFFCGHFLYLMVPQAHTHMMAHTEEKREKRTHVICDILSITIVDIYIYFPFRWSFCIHEHKNKYYNMCTHATYLWHDIVPCQWSYLVKATYPQKQQ